MRCEVVEQAMKRGPFGCNFFRCNSLDVFFFRIEKVLTSLTFIWIVCSLHETVT